MRYLVDSAMVASSRRPQCRFRKTCGPSERIRTRIGARSLRYAPRVSGSATVENINEIGWSTHPIGRIGRAGCLHTD
jgi:hypothetical protein